MRDFFNAALDDHQPWLETGSDDSRLRDAVLDLYYAAHWTADRPCDADALWRSVRDAAGFEPGGSPKPFETVGGIRPVPEMSRQEAIAEAWASIDGKLDRFRASKATAVADDQDCSYPGYMAEATELIKCIQARGYDVIEGGAQGRRGIVALEERVNELLTANGAEVERRRTAERELRALRDRLAGFFGARQAAEWQL